MTDQPSPLPFVSVVMPAYNRADLLQMTLTSLLNQTYPLDRYEVILVDDGSTDGTAEEAERLTKHWGGRFRVIRQPNGGGASARNAGFRASTADVIAFTDCDCVADEDWIEALISALNGSGAAGVGAPIRTGTPQNWISRYWQSSGIYRQRVRKGQVDYLLTGNVAFRRSALLAVNGFEEHKGVWGEDPDLSYKLLEAGYALTVTARGIVWHYGDPTSIRGLARSVYRYGFGNVIRSKRWKGKRQPTVELLRHASAVVLSPLLALLYAQRAGKLMWVFPFMLFIIVEHSAFVAGMVSAMSSNGYRGNA